MNPCDDVQARAAFLLALSEKDPERQAAWEHASDCQPCAKALKEGANLLSLLDSVPKPPPPSQEALTRVSRTIIAELESEKKGRGIPSKRLWRASFSAAVLLSWASLLFWLRPEFSIPSILFSGLLALLAALLVSIVPGEDFKGIFSNVSLNRSWIRWLGIGFVVLLSIGFSLEVGLEHVGKEGTLSMQTGLYCIFFEGVAALLPLGVAVYMALRYSSQGGTLRFMQAAGAGALAGQAAMHLICPLNATLHLLLFHSGGVLFAALSGALLAQFRPFSLAKT